MPKIILDTDIGTDVDDVCALGLALASPEVDLLAVTTVFDNVAVAQPDRGEGAADRRADGRAGRARHLAAAASEPSAPLGRLGGRGHDRTGGRGHDSLGRPRGRSDHRSGRRPTPARSRWCRSAR